MASKNTITKRVNIYINGREVGNDIKSIRAEMQKAVNQIAKMTRGSEEYNSKAREIRTLKSILQEHNQQLRTTEQRWSGLGNAGSGIKKYFGMLTAGLASITGLVFGLKKISDEIAQLDDLYSDVSKTTNLTRDEIVALNESFKKMDTRTSREELNRLAADAGKLGITGKKDILDFVDAGNQINVALGEDLGEGAIKNIGKLSQVFQTSTRELKNMSLKQQMLSIGSAINELGQSSTASEAYLVNFTQRLGGVASQAGISIQNILGYASALDQSGQAVEMSATALQNFIMKLMADPAKFAKLVGQEVQSFTELLKTDTNAAILQVLSAMNSKGGFQALIPMFQEMGLDGARAVGVLSALATNIDKVTEAQTVSNRGFAEAISITGEYEKKNNNMQAALEKARKEFREQALTLGEKLAPIVLKCTNGFTAFMKVLAKLPAFYDENKRLINSLAVAFSVLAVQSLIGKVKPALLAIRTTFVSLNTVIRANPIGLLISGLSMAASYLFSFNSQTETATKATGELASAVRAETREVNDLIARLTDSNIQEYDRKTILEEIRKIQPDLVKDIDSESLATETLTKRVQAYNEEQVKRMALAAKQDAVNEAIQKQNRVAMELANQEAEARKLLVNLQTDLPTMKIKKKTGDQSIWDWKEISENEKEKLIEEFNKIFTSSDDWMGKALRVQQLLPESTKQSRKYGTIEYKGADLSGIENVIKRISELRAESTQASQAVEQTKTEVENFQEAFGQFFKTRQKTPTNDPNTNPAPDPKPETDAIGDLIKVKEKELELAREMPGRTLQEIVARNQKIQAIQKEIKELNSLGIEDDDSKKMEELNQKKEQAAQKIASAISQVRNKLNMDSLSASEKEIIQTQQKYAELLSICRKYGLDSTEVWNAYNDELEAIFDKEMENEVSSFIDAEDKINQVLMSSSEQQKANVRQKYEELIALAEQYGIDTVALKQKMVEELAAIKDDEEASDIFGMSPEDWEDLEGKIGMAIELAGQLSNVWGQFNQIKANQEKKELQDYEKDCNRKKELLNKQLNAGKISQEQYNARVSQLDADLEKKKTEFAKKQAKREKAQSIFSAIISTAAAIAKALPNIPLSIIAGVLGAAQIAVIASQPLPEYAEGGLTDGAKMYIAGEAGQEWISPNWMLKDKTTGPIIKQLEMVRAGILTPEQLAPLAPDFHTMTAIPMFADGGYTSGSEIQNNYYTTETNQVQIDEYLERIDQNIRMLCEYLADPRNRQAIISNDLLERNTEEMKTINRLKRL